MLVAIVVGLVLGLVARDLGPSGENPNLLAQGLATIGSIFVQFLKLIVPPLVFTAIVSSIANFGELKNAARLAGQTLLWFAITALISVSVGMAIGILVDPGARDLVAPTVARTPTDASWLDFLKGLVPSNALGLSAAIRVDGGAPVTTLAFNTLQIVVLSIAIGVAALKAGEAGAPFFALVRSLLAIVRTLLGWVIKLTPVGTVGLLGTAVAQYGWDTLSALGAFAAAVYLGLAVIVLVIYPLLLLANGLGPLWFFRTAWPALQLAFVSRSSIGTLPVTEAVAERLGVPPAYAAFAVPLGATTKMDGCASIYPAIAAIFIAGHYHIVLGVSDYMLIAFVSVLGSAATAGVTGAIVMLTLTLSTLGLPLEGAGLLLAIDPILDMGRTAVNVAGQVLVPLIVAKREDLLEKRAYDESLVAI